MLAWARTGSPASNSGPTPAKRRIGRARALSVSSNVRVRARTAADCVDSINPACRLNEFLRRPACVAWQLAGKVARFVFILTRVSKCNLLAIEPCVSLDGSTLISLCNSPFASTELSQVLLLSVHTSFSFSHKREKVSSPLVMYPRLT